MRAARILPFVVLSIAALSGPSLSSAQSGAGAFLGFNVDFDHPMAGLQARLYLPDVGVDVPVTVAPSVETFFNLGFAELYQIDLNLLVALPRPYPELAPYAGTGLGLTRGESPFKDRIEDRNHESLNLIAGLQIEFGQRIVPFAQVRVSLIEGNDHTSVMGGAYLRW